MCHTYTMGQPLAIYESMDSIRCDTIRFEVHFVHQLSWLAIFLMVWRFHVRLKHTHTHTTCHAFCDCVSLFPTLCMWQKSIDYDFMNSRKFSKAICKELHDHPWTKNAYKILELPQINTIWCELYFKLFYLLTRPITPLYWIIISENHLQVLENCFFAMLFLLFDCLCQFFSTHTWIFLYVCAAVLLLLFCINRK